MSNTGPAEIAALIGDDSKYRTYVVLELGDIKRRVTNLEANQSNVSSSVKGLQKNTQYTLKEMVGGFIVLCGALGALISFIVWVIGHAGKGAP